MKVSPRINRGRFGPSGAEYHVTCGQEGAGLAGITPVTPLLPTRVHCPGPDGATQSPLPLDAPEVSPVKENLIHRDCKDLIQSTRTARQRACQTKGKPQPSSKAAHQSPALASMTRRPSHYETTRLKLRATQLKRAARQSGPRKDGPYTPSAGRNRSPK